MENQPYNNQPPIAQFQPQQVPQQPIMQQPVLEPKKRGRVSVVILSLLVVLLIAAVAGVYLWQHKKVTDLQSQLRSSASSKSSSLANSSNSSQEFLNLNSYGVKIPLSKNIQDLYYVQFKDDSSNDVLAFSTQSLSNAEPSCLAVPTIYSYSYESDSLNNNPPQTPIVGTPFGIVLVTTSALPASQVGTLDNEAGTLVAHVNGHYFYYSRPQATCLAVDGTGKVINQADSSLLTSQSNSFQAAIKKIEPLN